MERNPEGEEAVAETSGVLSLDSWHLRVTQVELVDRTDSHNELVHERQFLLHQSENPVLLSGNLFLVEDTVGGTGYLLVRQAPLPWSRPVPSAADLRITPRERGGYEFAMLEPCGGTSGSWTVLEYRGGRLDRARALHRWQSSRRPVTLNHTLPCFLCNTWGDRSQDSRIREDFILAEIEAAAKLGADVVQIDDGWQRGVPPGPDGPASGGGLTSGFWNADARYWEPHPERFSRGLGPVVERARARGVKIGLWFVPDSWNDLANWGRDADCILGFFNTFGIEHLKIDGVSAGTPSAMANLQRFFQAVLDGSRGRVVFDLDITADTRPGYFGAMEVGPLFVENRYTDWHNYWPHQTLRNLWKLSRWVDPRRLRMEFLNNTRNKGLYAGDPLAPALYTPATLFASVMFSNPLGWFEASNLPDTYRESVAAMVRVWKRHRVAMFEGSTIVPIGAEPDGVGYTGFMSASDAGDAVYLVVFRELNPAGETSIVLPGVDTAKYRWELLAGAGDVASAGGSVRVNIPEQFGFVFARGDKGARM